MTCNHLIKKSSQCFVRFENCKFDSIGAIKYKYLKRQGTVFQESNRIWKFLGSFIFCLLIDPQQPHNFEIRLNPKVKSG